MLGGREEEYRQHAARSPDSTTLSHPARKGYEEPGEQWSNVRVKVRLTVARELLQGERMDMSCKFVLVGLEQRDCRLHLEVDEGVPAGP